LGVKRPDSSWSLLLCFRDYRASRLRL
jgi:hypothetical protein